MRTFFYQLARVVCIGALVMLVGYWARYCGYLLAWAIGFMLVALFNIVTMLWHVWQLPRTRKLPLTDTKLLKGTFAFFRQPGVISIVLFILLYNFGEAQMQRIVPLFLMSKETLGGLGLSNDAVGLVFGCYGTIALSLGALASGWCVARFGLKPCLWSMTSLMVISNMGYLLLADSPKHFAALAVFVVIAAQACFGLANSAYMCVLIKVAKHSTYALTWYALASSLMALGMMLPGMLSGVLLARFTFVVVFIVILALSLLSFIVTVNLRWDDLGRR